MCGIIGIYNSKKETRKIAKKMLEKIKHRGPDDQTIYVDGRITLGMNRLSILDLRKGLYPIMNERKDILLVYNGEIYNFKDIRKKLEKKGHKFRTNTDAEVIIHSYEEKGEKCLKDLNGMFAFALWDKREGKLFLARDRLGIKPLYYYTNNKEIIFGSEIKAILEYGIKAEICQEILGDYLINNLYDQENKTFFKGINKLPQAHYLIARGGEIQLKKYWVLKKSEEKKEEEIKNILKDSIKKRLVSDVPVGTCLSGGLDSSTIVCLTNKFINEGTKRNKKQKTFSAIYPGENINEEQFIEEVTQKAFVEKNFVYPNEEILFKEMKKLIWHQEEPFRSSSIFAQWCVMKKAKEKNVKVILDGQGADELFGGYLPYYIINIKELIKKGNFIQAIKETVLGRRAIKEIIFKKLHQRGNKKIISKIIKKDFFKIKNKDKWGKRQSLQKSLYLDLTKESVPSLLRYEDKNSMAFSIESRVPFLDHRLVEAVFSMPSSKKIYNGTNKFLLRKIARGIVPEKILNRKDKIGFETPEGKWMKLKKETIKEIFMREDFASKEFIDQKELLKYFEEFIQGKLNKEAHSIFWKVLNVEIWKKIFIDKNESL